MTAYTARQLTTNKIQNPINQVGHMFVVGDLVRLSGGIFVKAQANSEANAALVGMVSAVVTADSFNLCQAGYVVDLDVTHPVVANTVYYLSPTSAGNLTSTKPTTTGQAIVQCFIADTTTSGYFIANDAQMIEPGLFGWQTINANQTLVNNTGYFANGGAQLNLLLPATSIEGDTVEIISLGVFGFKITQAGGQQMFTTGGASTLGALGSAEFTDLGDKAILVYEASANVWHLAADSGSPLIT